MLFEVIIGSIGVIGTGLLAWIAHQLMQTRDAVMLIVKDIDWLKNDRNDHEERLRDIERRVPIKPHRAAD